MFYKEEEEKIIDVQIFLLHLPGGSSIFLQKFGSVTLYPPHTDPRRTGAIVNSNFKTKLINNASYNKIPENMEVNTTHYYNLTDPNPFFQLNTKCLAYSL